jgi:hypothetical protein
VEPGIDRALRLVVARQVQRRRFNERLAAVDTPHLDSDLTPFRCECGLIGCSAIVKLTGPEFAEVRADSRHFVVFAAHVLPEAETVISSRRGWSVVESRAGPGAEGLGGVSPDRAGDAAETSRYPATATPGPRQPR